MRNHALPARGEPHVPEEREHRGRRDRRQRGTAAPDSGDRQRDDREKNHPARAKEQDRRRPPGVATCVQKRARRDDECQVRPRHHPDDARGGGTASMQCGRCLGEPRPDAARRLAHPVAGTGAGRSRASRVWRAELQRTPAVPTPDARTLPRERRMERFPACAVDEKGLHGLIARMRLKIHEAGTSATVRLSFAAVIAPVAAYSDG